jgi:TonB family protein
MSRNGQSLRKAVFAVLAVSVFTTVAHAQDSQSPDVPKVIRKSGGVLQGTATKRVAPTYPPLAKAARVGGSVVVEVTLDEEGGVMAARAVSGHPLLKDAAVTAARGWKFKPTLLQGEPVKVIGTITFNFNLDTKEEIPAEIQQLLQEIDASPNSPELRLKLGMAYAVKHRNEDAIDAYGRALALKPDYSAACYQMGLSYKDIDQYDKAEEFFTKALSLKPDNAEEIYLGLARTYFVSERSDAAFEAAKHALAIKADFPDAHEAHAVIGTVLLERRRFDEALASLKQAAKLTTSVSQAHFYLGFAYSGIGDREAAMNEYRILKETDEQSAAFLLSIINKRRD